jgi:hypothetical protein
MRKVFSLVQEYPIIQRISITKTILSVAVPNKKIAKS